MPIYGFGTIGAPWVLEKNITDQTLYKLVNVVKTAKKSCTYHNNESFIRSIKDNFPRKENAFYISTFDSSKTNIPTANYQVMLEDLIKKCNEILIKNKIFSKYKFDIMGNWTTGTIIIMVKK